MSYYLNELSRVILRLLPGLRVCKQPSVKLRLGKTLVLYLSSQISCLLSDELNYIIIITMFVPFTLLHVDRQLKRLDNHSQYSVE